jgi:hypothetical protein
MKKPINRLIAHGDIHGHLARFKENLLNANLIDANNSWIGGDSILVQVGDVIDRGPQSLEALDFLDHLQRQSNISSKSVIRLFGNHEMMNLMGEIDYKHLENDSVKIREKIRRGVLENNIILSYVYKNRLFVHGGLRSKIRESLKTEIRREHGISVESIRLEDISNRMNVILVESVKNDDFTHPIFGQDGVLWTKFDAIMRSDHANQVKQIVGHTIRTDGDYSFSLGRIGVDFGLFLGHHGYLVIENDHFKYVIRKRGVWEDIKLGDF